MNELRLLTELWRTQRSKALERNAIACRISVLLLGEPIGTKVRLGNALLEHIPRSLSATLDNPTEDGYIETEGVDQDACLIAAPSRQNAVSECYYGGDYEFMGEPHSYRAYVEWPISVLAGVTLTANPIFKYHGNLMSADEGEINPITEEAPSDATDANLRSYIASGTAYVDPFNIVNLANQSQDLGASAKTDLQTAVTAEQSWFAIGFQSPGDECPPGLAMEVSSFFSEEKADGANPKPTLYVEYMPKAAGRSFGFIIG